MRGLGHVCVLLVNDSMQSRMKRDSMILAADDDRTRQRCVGALQAASLATCVDAPYESAAFYIAMSPELFRMRNQGRWQYACCTAVLDERSTCMDTRRAQNAVAVAAPCNLTSPPADILDCVTQATGRAPLTIYDINSAEALKSKGLDVLALRRLRFEPVELQGIGVTYDQMQAAGYSLRELVSVFFLSGSRDA